MAAADQEPLVGEQQCARCKRECRGDWDRYHAPAGMVCHVCANLAANHSPVEAAPQHAPVKAPDIPAPVLIPDEPAAPQREGKGTLLEQFDDFKETGTFRAAIWALAIAGIGAAVLVYVFAGGFSPPRIENRGARVVEEVEQGSEGGAESGGLGLLGSADQLTEGQGVVVVALVWVLQRLFSFVPSFAALFWTLWKAGRLPCYRWWASALHVGAAAAIMALATGIVRTVAGSMPMGAGLYALAAYGVIFYIIYEVYDFFLRDLLTLGLARMLLFLLMIPVEAFVYGGLGLLLLERSSEV